MRGIFILVKQTLRLLLRNKGFLFFIVLLPIASISILNVKDYENETVSANENQIYRLEKMSDQICYMASNTMLPVKLYDSTGSKLGYEFAKELAKAGLFQIFYYDSSEENLEDISDNIDKVCKKDHVEAIVYFGPELASELRSGKVKKGMTGYDSHADDRTQLFFETLSQVTGQYVEIVKDAKDDQEAAEIIQSYEKTQLKLQQEQLQNGSDTELSYHQNQIVVRLGYVIAILSIGYLFSGVLIADTVIKERQYKVYSRIQLTDLAPAQYIISKYIVSVITVLLQTIVIAITLPFIVKQSYGITMPNLLFLIVMLGMIFNTMSLCIGILCNNVMNTNYIAFVVWSLSSLLSGCYFDLSNAGTMMKRISNLMPQKWALTAAKRMIVGINGAYGIMLIVTLAFLMLIGVFAVVGTTKGTQEA